MKNIKFLASGEIRLPITELELGKTKARLQGWPFEWKELKVSAGEKAKSFTP